MIDNATSRNDGSDRREMTRRRMLVTASGTAVGLVGTTALSGSVGAQTSGWESAPADYPTIDLTAPDPSTTGAFPSDADELVVYVHGWQEASNGGGENQGYTLETALRANGYDAPTVTAMWDSNTDALDTETAQERAAVAAPRLAAWLDEYLTDNPETTVRAVSHSLGAQVILGALEALAGDRVLPDVALLGAAVDDDTVCTDGEYATGIETAAGAVRSYHSENDGVICSMYSLLEGASGLGCEGSDCGGFFSRGSTPENFTDNDVTDTVDSHGEYGRPDVGCVPQVLEDFSVGA